MLASLFNTFELLLGWSAFAILITHKAYPFPLYMSSIKFQCLHILKGLDQTSTYTGIYFSLAFFLKLLNWFLYILNASIDSNYELVLFNVMITAFKWVNYFFSDVFFLIFFAFSINIKRGTTFFYSVNF